MVKSAIMVFLAFHPALMLLAMHEQFRVAQADTGLGHVFGIALLGGLLGCFLLALAAKLKIEWKLKSVLDMAFLASPYLLFFLASHHQVFRSGVAWFLFIAAYMMMGVMLYLRHNPNLAGKAETYISALVILYLVIALMSNFIYHNVSFSPDSLSFYDISQNLFGPVNTIRQYQHFTEYGISFPYLFPLMIRSVNVLTGFGIFSGVLINLVATLLSMFYLIKISGRLTQSTYPGLIAAAIMVFNPEYMGELMAARAVPLSVLCVLLVLNVAVTSRAFAIVPQPGALPGPPPHRWLQLLRKESAGRDLFFMGVFAGAGMVIRFDFLAIAGLLGVALVLIFFVKKSLFRTVPFYVLGLLVFTTPWLLYSMLQFQTLWISDNNGTLTLIHPLIPQRFFHPDETVPTIFNDLAGWVESRQNMFMHRISGLVYLVTRPVAMAAVLGMVALFIASTKDKLRRAQFRNYRIMLAVIAVIYVAKTVAIYLVGYGDLRYHAELLVIVSFIILCTLYRNVDLKQAKARVWSGFLALVCVVSAVSSFQPMANSMGPRLVAPFIDTTRILPQGHLLAFEQLLMEHGQHPCGRDVRIFSLEGLDVFVLGAFTDILAFGKITNINEQRLLYLMEHFIQPNYVYANDEFNEWMAVLSRYYLLRRVGESYAFALTPLGDFTQAGTAQAVNFYDGNWEYGVHREEQVILFENTPENYGVLSDAAALRTSALSVGIVSIATTEDWIRVYTEISVSLSAFAYPNEIMVLR